jgi:hypothetical protein
MIHKSPGFGNLFATNTHPPILLSSKIEVKFHKCRPPPPLGSFWQPSSSHIVQLGLGRPAIVAFMIDIIVMLRIDETIGNSDSPSAGQCHQNI